MTMMKIVGGEETVVFPVLYSRRALERGGPLQSRTNYPICGRRKMPTVIKKTAVTPGITTRLSCFPRGVSTLKVARN